MFALSVADVYNWCCSCSLHETNESEPGSFVPGVGFVPNQEMHMTKRYDTTFNISFRFNSNESSRLASAILVQWSSGKVMPSFESPNFLSMDLHDAGFDLPRGFRTLEMVKFRPRCRAAGNCSGHRSGLGSRELNACVEG
ncbi:hypothetical protein QMK17_26195, partial [Rhodococcus sp. G-MC3]|uniref:hypothetical protein n=1 Tax=Rhodococcus sp. G-MC3 TaxID=3046209 RepID=UPI0024BA7957